MSRQTVSNALNAPHVVSPGTLERVLATVDALGYRPAVVGFDDTPAAAAVGLSSVAQPLADVARACLDQLLGQLGPAPRPSAPVLLTPGLVVRRSS